MTLSNLDWEQVAELVANALELSVSERPAYLQSLTVPAHIRAEVESLILASQRDDSTTLAIGRLGALLPDTPASSTSLWIGKRLGAYEIVREIGRGGMGLVFLARRADDLYSRDVAIKLMLSLLAGEDFARRFRRETRILGRLQHPAIVSLLDAGATDELQPYMVMEFVDGLPLHEYADRWQLPLADILRLLVTLCDALSYAHRQGIIHRDIKPSNVLVDARGQLKLLDFGIAQIVETSLDQDATATHFRAITPNYASPEQITGGEATIRSDIYSVGVVLYVLLTGAPPFRLTGLPPAEVKQILQNHEPELPSDKHMPRLQASELKPLDSVIARALHPEPHHRYEHADELKADLLRVLDHELPEASTPRRRAGRWWARRRRAHQRVAIASGATVLLGAAAWLAHSNRPANVPAKLTSVSLAVMPLRPPGAPAWASVAAQEALTDELTSGDQVRIVPALSVAGAMRELKLENIANPDSAQLERLGKLLAVEYVLTESIAPQAADRLSMTLTLRKRGAPEPVLVRSATFASSSLASETQRLSVDVARVLPLRQTLQVSPSLLPRSPQAVRHYAEGLDHLRSLDVTAARADFEQAAAVEPGSAMIHAASARTWDMLGYRKRAISEADQAEKLSAALSTRRAKLTVQAQADEIRHKWREAIAAYSTLRDYDPDDLEYVLGLARCQMAADKSHDALATLQTAEAAPSLLGADPRLELLASSVEESAGHHREALQHAENALASGRERGATQLVAQAQNARASALESLGDIDRGMAAAQQAQQLFESARDDRGLGTSLIEMGNFLEDHARFAEAGRAYERAKAIFTRLGDQEHAGVAENDLGIVAADQGNFQQAIDHYRSALASFTQVEDTQRIPLELNNIGTVEKNLGLLEAAKQDYTRALHLLLNQEDPNRIAREYTNLGAILIQEGKLDQAERYFQQAYDTYSRSGQVRSLFYAATGLAHVAWNRGDLADAHIRYQNALKASRGLADTQQQSLLLRVDAHVLHDMGNDVQAQQELRESVALRTANQQQVATAETTLSSLMIAIDNGEHIDPARFAALVSIFESAKEEEDAADARLLWARSSLLAQDISGASRQIELARPALQRVHTHDLKQHLLDTEAALALARKQGPAARSALEAAFAEARRTHDLPEQMHLEVLRARLSAQQHTASKSQLARLSAHAASRGFTGVARQISAVSAL